MHHRFPPKLLLSPAIALLSCSKPPQSLLIPFPFYLRSRIPNPNSLLTPPTNSTSSIFRSFLHFPCMNFSSLSGPTMPRPKRSRFPSVILDDHEEVDFVEVVRLIREDSSRLEAELNQKNLMVSPSFVIEVLFALNKEGIPALRFFNWAMNCCPGFVPSAKIYNQLVNNLGRVDDYETMFGLLTKLSTRGFCLTEKAFAFLTLTRPDNLTSSVEKIVGILNGVGSCRGSGIFSLIRHLCSMNAFDLAISVMEKTSKSTRYYNALIAAKCKNGDFQGVREVFDEMSQSNCDPDMNSFNYILGCLLKYNRVNEACGLLETMERLGFTPDEITYELLVFHACKASRIDSATQFLDKMLLEGLRPRLKTHAAFIKGYFLLGREADAFKYVLDMSLRDKFSVNVNYSMLSSLFCKSKRVSEAGRILYEMMEKGYRPNQRVYFRVVKMLHKQNKGDMASQLQNMFMKF
ncbi:Pentatricopeptide repeat-containing protein [Rhynchospora pubera]|uniref:Pentatricopeptide repeat-containing protein n=1 Tax=Rhynchospora pubera TaxID=906938 RepID=A0AAV8F290_9POAL|nr:Pentatricopeptide repeat-containing protein [Rhynchospora pubera]